MEVSLKVGCLPNAVGKQPSDPCSRARMPHISYLCVMSGSLTLNGDDDDDEYSNQPISLYVIS